jgi:hypothetical protein
VCEEALLSTYECKAVQAFVEHFRELWEKSTPLSIEDLKEMDRAAREKRSVSKSRSSQSSA